jgi:hypothetical protein
LALVFAICALLSSWNPFAAPVGLLLGAAVALAAWRMVTARRGGRLVALWALALGVLAVTASSVILLLSAGAFSSTSPGRAIGPGRTPGEIGRMLDEAQQRTAAARGRATGELDQVSPTRPGESGASDTPERGRGSQKRASGAQ